MASPFSIFRRYQGILLAVFGVALMVAFVVLPAVIQMQQAGGGGGYSDDAVLTWTGGEVTQNDVRLRQQRRRMAFEFLQRLQEVARAKPGGADMNRLREIGVLEQLAGNRAGNAVESMLLAQKGRDMGMSVDEQAVDNFLMSLTDDVFLTKDELADAKRSAVRGTSLAAMTETLKEELLAYYVRQMALSGVAPTNQMEIGKTVTTPSKAWEAYNRLNRRVTAEFVAFPVEEFVSKIDDPSSSEITTYYDEYKNEYPNPGNPRPGFKRAREVEFHYVAADFQKYLEEEKANVTRQQVEDYYEENKESFAIEEPQSPVEEFDPDDPRGAIPSPPRVSADEPVVEPVDEPETPATEPETEPAVDTPPEETPADEVPDVPSEETTEPADDTPSEDEPTEEESSDSGCQDEPADTDETPAATLPDVEPPADTTPPESTADDTTADDTTGESTNDDLTIPEKDVKYQPLADVEDTIRAAIARPLAEKRLTAAMSKATVALKKYYDQTIDFEAEIRGTKDPGKFDGKALAKKLGLKYSTTGLITRRALLEEAEDATSDEESAKAHIAQSYAGDSQNPDFFVNIGYRDGLANYQPIETQVGGRETVYLAWKVSEIEAFVPELADIKDEVTKAWKLEQARKLAEQAAADLAAKVDGKKPLKGQVGKDHKVFTPDAFSYYDPISVLMMRFRGQQPRLAAIEDDIEDESSESIKRVAVQMPVGGVRVAPNAAQTIYYVIRLAEDDSTPAESREKFMQSIVDNPAGEGAPNDLLYVGGRDQDRLFMDWRRELHEQYEVRELDPDFFQNDG